MIRGSACPDLPPPGSRHQTRHCGPARWMLRHRAPRRSAVPPRAVPARSRVASRDAEASTGTAVPIAQRQFGPEQR